MIQLLEAILVQGDDLLQTLMRPRMESVFSPDVLRFENYSFSTMEFAVKGRLVGYLAEKVGRSVPWPYHRRT